MATTSESGHVRNVSNFERLVAAATSFGTDYNPSKPSLALPAMQSLLASSIESLAILKQAVSVYETAIDARKLAFASLNSFITRIYNALKSSDSSPEADHSAAILVRKLRGQRASERLSAVELETLKAEGKTVKQISSSQMGFDTRLDNFDKLIHLLSTIAEYNPNEADLKVDALRNRYNNLYDKNKAVIEAQVQMNKARSQRFNVLYKPLTGMIDLALDAKMYIKSVAGAGSVPYKQISGLSFRSLAG